jgi:hypothetical protein
MTNIGSDTAVIKGVRYMTPSKMKSNRTYKFKHTHTPFSSQDNNMTRGSHFWPPPKI